MHECEIRGEELAKIRKDLYAAKSTNGNMAKIKAIESQIKRQGREAAPIKS